MGRKKDHINDPFAMEDWKQRLSPAFIIGRYSHREENSRLPNNYIYTGVVYRSEDTKETSFFFGEESSDKVYRQY